MGDVRWIKTDKHVYGTIMREHGKDLTTFASFSNPHPSEIQYQPEMMTEWGLKGSDYPLLKIVTTWEDERRKETEEHKYFIAIAIKES